LNNLIDQKVLAEYSNAASFVSAQDLGGSGTGAIAITQSNVMSMFTTAGRKLDKYNRGQNDRFAVVGPTIKETLKLSVGGRETGFGDKIQANGLLGNIYGFEVYFSNNIPYTAVLTSSSIPVAGESITIDGVVFNWVANGTNCDAAGDVSISTTEDGAYANLVLAINGTTAGTNNTYYDVSADDRETLNQASISASYTTHVTTITGYGDTVITEATTNLAVTSITQYPLFGIKKATDFVIQKAPNVDFRTCENLLGKKVYAWTTYGVKTFLKEKKSLVYAKIDTTSNL
jgi:hypothetical protein